jgi:hypothetical protein
MKREVRDVAALIQVRLLALYRKRPALDPERIQ